MSEVACPACQKALPDSVLSGPAQAVVRCEGCSTLLLWSHGKVVRSARSNPSTLQGVPVQKPPSLITPASPPPATPAPAAAKPAARAPARTLMGIPTPPSPAKAKADVQALDDVEMVADPLPPAPPKVDPPKTQTPGKVAPLKRDPPGKPAEKAAEKPKAEPHIAAAIAQPTQALPGPMEDPKDWFGDAKVQPSLADDEEPTTVGPAPIPDPLPPLEPQSTNLTAEAPVTSGLFKSEKKAAPKKVEAKPEPKKPDSTPAPPTKPAEAKSSLFAMSTVPEPLSAQKTAMVAKTSSSAPTMMAPAPELPKKDEAKPELFKKDVPKTEQFKAEAFKAEPAKRKDPSPLPLPPSPTPEPVPQVLSPKGLGPAALDLSPDQRKPPVVLAAVLAGGALVLVGILFFALRSGKPAETPPPPKVVEKAPPPPVENPPPPAENPPPVVAVKPPEPPPQPVAPAPPPKEEPPPPPEPKQPVRVARAEEPSAEEPAPRRRRSANKRAASSEIAPARSTPEPRDDSAAIERAKDAYKRGNEKLFSGNSSAAVAAYKESLSIYPGYAAGYRGLGLAYAQSGQTAEAIKALKTYVKNAPTAHDVPLIRQRIERLEKSPQD
jgi:hypothetical protein